MDFSDSPYVDHSVMENVAGFKNDYESTGGIYSSRDVEIINRYRETRWRQRKTKE